MTIKEWLDYDFICSRKIGTHCIGCLYEDACKEKFHCGHEVVSRILNELKTKEDIDEYVKKVKNSSKSWVLSCDGRGTWKRTKSSYNNRFNEMYFEN